MKKGDKVVKLIIGGGFETASIQTIAAADAKRGLVSLDASHVFKPADIKLDGVSTYRIADGRATANYIPGFTSRIVELEE